MPPARWTAPQSLVSRSKSTLPVLRTMMEALEVEVTAREAAVDVETISNPEDEAVDVVVEDMVEVVEDMVGVVEDTVEVVEDTVEVVEDAAAIEATEEEAAMDTMEVEVMGVAATTEIMEDTEMRLTC